MNFLLEPVLGICRFSFCGNGDFAAYSRVKTPEDVERMRQETFDTLYAPQRMEKRFFLFENFLLPSVEAQRDKNFILIVLTSDVMPEEYRNRLQAICDKSQHLDLVVSSESTVHAALWPTIEKYNENLAKPLPQFRIDDDDCLSADYVLELRSYMLRLGDKMPLCYSRSNGIVVTQYGDDPEPNVFRANLPFNSMGTAIRVHGERTIFSFGHNALHKRFPAIVDNAGIGYIAIKVDGHDSLPIDMNMPFVKKTHTLLESAEADNILTKWFPFLNTPHGTPTERLKELITQVRAL